MNELAELLLTLIVGLPFLSAVIAAVPGAWWPDERRSWFSTFALGVALIAATLMVSSPLWSGASLRASIPIGTWLAAHDSATHPISLRIALDPLTAAFAIAPLLAGLRISLQLPSIPAVQGRQLAAATLLLIAAGSAVLVVAATSRLIQGATLVLATAATGCLASFLRNSSLSDDPDETVFYSPTILVADVVLLLACAMSAAGGSLDTSSAAAGAAIADALNQASAPKNPAVLISASFIALGLCVAAGARLALFPFLYEADRACRQFPLIEAVRAGIVVPASAALLFQSQDLVTAARSTEHGLLISAGLTAVLACWCAATSRASRRAEAHLITAGNGLLALAAATGDPRAIPAAATWVTFQSLAAVRAILRWSDLSPEDETGPSSDRSSARRSASSRPAQTFVALGRATFYLETLVTSAVTIPWKVATVIATAVSTPIAMLAASIFQWTRENSARVLDDLDEQSETLAVIGALMAVGILLLTLRWN